MKSIQVEVASFERITQAEERVSNLEDTIGPLFQFKEEGEERLRKNEAAIGEVADSIKRTNIRVIWIAEEENRVKATEIIFQEVLIENFPQLGNPQSIKITEAEHTCWQVNPKHPTPRHIVVKLSKLSDRKNSAGC